MALCSAFAEARWGPAARGFSLAYLHTLIHPVLRLKMTQNAQRFQIRALLIQRESSPFHMHLLEDAEQCQGESSQEKCLQDLLQEMGWRWGSSPPSCIHHLHVHLASPVSPRSKARKACSPKAQTYRNNQLLRELRVTESQNCLESQNHLD